MTTISIRAFVVGLLAVLPLVSVARAAPDIGRVAILCAYEPEWQALLPSVDNPQERVIAGVAFVSGTIAGKPVVVVETGISMVNATMAAQLALDHFKVDDLIVMGIAGGVDPALHIGDVVVPAQWSQYLEAVIARDDHGSYRVPRFFPQTKLHYGMIFPQPVELGRAPAAPEPTTWFRVDPHLLAAARTAAADVVLAACDAGRQCAEPAPRVVIGGNGVSGTMFVDNAAFRDFVFQAFTARALDMESAAVAQVAEANHVPFLAFRSLSDLAGGDADTTRMKLFEALASRNAVAVLKAFLAGLT